MENILLLPYLQSKGDRLPVGWLMSPQLRIQNQKHPVLRPPNHGGVDSALGQAIGCPQIQQSGSAKPLLVESLQLRLNITTHIMLVPIDTPQKARRQEEEEIKKNQARIAAERHVDFPVTKQPTSQYRISDFVNSFQ